MTIPCSTCGGQPCREGCAPRLTYRERRERRTLRLRGRATDRRQDATATLDRDHAQYGGDIAFATQPGHIPERARMISRTDRAFASLDKAASMDARADAIDAQLERSIYSDDPDAIERLTERIATLETRRERMKAVNIAVRRATRTATTYQEREAALRALAEAGDITTAELRELVVMMRASPGVYALHAPTYSYALTNLSGNIARQRERLTRLQRAHGTA